MLVVGLTGNIASGKTTVSNILRKLGAVIIDADLIAREILIPYTEGWQQIVEVFGKDILSKNDEINREKLGALVFSNKEALKKLNGITHPLIGRITLERLEAQRNSPNPSKMLVIDAALLLESNLRKLVDEVWLVKVNKDVQLNRLMQRNNLTEAEALARINSQIPWEDKAHFAAEIIDNSTTPEDIENKIIELWKMKVK